ncbi:MAG: iron dependent repressor, metal binding and dimerization domain protein [Bacteroidota bacterium]
MNYNPIFILILFLIFLAILFLLFRPGKGYYWLIKSSLEQNKKTITEDILKQLYHSEISQKEVGMEFLTSILKFSDSEILEAVKELEAKTMISTKGNYIKLNSSGREYALKIIRVHRLWEKYLAERTGYDKAEWHDRAELMEHKLTEEQTNILASELGNPMYDPHGDPIPTHTGKISKLEGVPLSSLKVYDVGKIIHIEDEPDVIYRQILAENIHIGSQIRVIESDSQRVVFYAEGEEFILAPIVAANITVLTLDKEEIEHNAVRLSSLKENEKGEIISISKECRGEARRRLLDLGFVKGSEVSIDLMGPLQNPRGYKIKGTTIALRNEQASNILIKKEKNGKS